LSGQALGYTVAIQHFERGGEHDGGARCVVTLLVIVDDSDRATARKQRNGDGQSGRASADDQDVHHGCNVARH
jgi:hypothetical protein